jgi:hypothetical protein
VQCKPEDCSNCEEPEAVEDSILDHGVDYTSFGWGTA